MTTGNQQSGGSAGGSYVLNFTLSGTGKNQLDGVVTALKTISAQAGNGAASAAINQAANAIQNLGNQSQSSSQQVVTLAAKFVLLKGSLEILGNYAQGLQNWGTGVVKTIGHVANQMLVTNGAIESSIQQLKIVGKLSDDQAKQVVHNVNDLVATTPFMTQELQDLATTLIIGKVKLDDWKDSAGKVKTLSMEAAKGFSRMDEATTKFAGHTKVNSLSIMADFAALTGNVGEKMPFFVKGMQRLLTSGSGIMLLDQLNAEAREVLMGKGSTKLKGTAEEAMQRVYKYLQSKQAVGMAAIASTTAQGIMSNLKEIPLQILKAIGGDVLDKDSPYNKLKGAYMALFTDIANTVSNPKWQKSMEKIVTPLIEIATKVFAKVGKVLSSMMEWFTEHPMITKTLIIILSVVAAIGVLIGTLVLLGVKLALGYIAWLALKVAVKGAWAAIVGFARSAAVSLLSLSPWTYALIAAGAALYGLYKWGQSIVNSSPALKKFFTDTKVLIKGVSEAIANWGGSTTKISRETADELEKAGMLNPFLKLMKTIRGIEKVFQKMWDGIYPIIDKMTTMLGRMFGLSEEKLDSFNTKMGDGKDRGQEFANTLYKSLHVVVAGIGKAVLAFARLNLIMQIVSGTFKTGFVLAIVVVETLLNLVFGLVKGLVVLASTFSKLRKGDFAGIYKEWGDYTDQFGAAMKDPWKNLGSFADEEKAKIRDAGLFVNQAKEWSNLDDIVQERVGTPIPKTLQEVRTNNAPAGISRYDVTTPERAPRGPIEMPVQQIQGTVPGTKTINLVVDGKVLSKVVLDQMDRIKARSFPQQL